MAEVPKLRKSLEVSHGRGGAGNIGEDPTPYADGEIVRQGVAGDHGDGAFSTGRGGGGNIGSPGMKATARKDDISIPEAALRQTADENAHVGRGGAGNVHNAEEGGKKSPTGLADRLKAKLFKKKAAKTEPATATTTT